MSYNNEPTKTYSYTDKESNLLFQVCRFDSPKKQFLQRRPNGSGWVWNLDGITTVPYNLPKVISSQKVFIVEGEKDADRLSELGITATCNPMGAGKWKDDYNHYFNDKEVIIIPDNDIPGRYHAHKVAKSLKSESSSVKVLTLPDLPEKGDISDWLDQGNDYDDLCKQIDNTPIWEISKIEVPPLSIPKWPVLSQNALQGLAGEFVSIATKNSEADPAAVLLTFLTRFGIEAGSGPHIVVGDARQYARLFTAVVGRSSLSRKGTSAQPTKRLFSPSAGLTVETNPGPLSTGEGIVHAVRDDEDDKIDKRLFVLDEELSAALKIAQREGNTLSSTLRCLWDEGNVKFLTKTTPTQTTNAHVGIVAHITIKELKSLLSKDELYNGFANRFLWCCAERKSVVALPVGIPKDKLHDIQAKVLDCLAISKIVRRYPLTNNAKSLWVNIYPTLCYDKDNRISDILNRAAVQVLRLSLIYALLDRSRAISENHINCALAVWNYCKESAEYIFGRSI